MVASVALQKKLPQHSLISSTDEADNPALRDPDVRTMLDAKSGDELAFASLVTSYQQRLVSVLSHVVGDVEIAEDVAQEVFFRVYQARHSYEPTARFSTWLFRIAHNLALNRRRDEGRRREFAPHVDDSASGVRPIERMLADKSGMMPQRQFDKREMQSIVNDAVNTLNEHQRMAVLLHKYEGMSYSEIAEALDMTAAAVKSLLSRARENLREKLEGYVYDGVIRKTVSE
jgi:RNA polymerase sigma-70 factor (ECF subfamily)